MSASWSGDAEPSGRYQAGMPLRAVRMNVAAIAGSVCAKAPEAIPSAIVARKRAS